MKGKRWYQATEVAESYESKRFSGGGQLIDRRERQAVLEALSPADGDRILEIACGTGRFSVMLADHGVPMVGLDISTPMLQHGRRKARNVGVTEMVDFMRGDAARLPFPDDTFDAVLAMRFFHLAPTPRRFLSEMKRVTTGPIVFDTFNSPSTRSVYNWLLPMGSRLYTRSDVRRMVSAAGLSIESVTHDFLLPYGLYRSIPGAIATPLRMIDRRLIDLGVGHRFGSVSFWTVQ